MASKNMMIAAICLFMLAASGAAADVHAVLSLDKGDGALIEVFNGNLSENSTALDLLSASGLNFSVETMETGEVVTSIEDVANDDMTAWVFQVNGAVSEVSVDQYILQNDDMVLFTFMTIEPPAVEEAAIGEPASN